MNRKLIVIAIACLMLGPGIGMASTSGGIDDVDGSTGSEDSTIDTEGTLNTSFANETYLTEWSNTSFWEKKNPLDRFDHFKVNDTDDDGVVNLSSLDYEEPGQMVNSTLEVTNTDIETAMTKLGVTKDDIAAAIDAVLSWNSSYDEEREEAIQNVYLGDYVAAANGITGTPADMVYWCGNQRTDWVIGIPVTIDCDGGTPAEMFVNADPVIVIPCVSSIDDLLFEVVFSGVAGVLDSRRRPFGAGYAGHNGGVKANVGNTYEGSIDLRGLCGNHVEGMVLINPVDVAMEPGDKLIYTKGNEFNRDLTIRMMLDRDEFSLSLDFEVRLRSNGWDVRVELDPGDTPSYKRLELRIGSDVVLQAIACDGVISGGCDWDPNLTWAEVGYRTVYQSRAAGEKTQIRLYGPEVPLKELEFKATLFDNGNPTLDFQLVGLPIQSWLRYDTGQDRDSTGVASLDFTDKSYRNYVRTFVADGEVKDWAIEATVKDVNRLRVVSGKPDPWAGDNDPFVMNSANFETRHGETFLEAKENFWKGFQSKLDVWCWSCDPNQYKGYIDVLCGIWCDSFVREEGGPAIRWNSAAFNAYFWAIHPLLLDFDDCILDHGGVCA